MAQLPGLQKAARIIKLQETAALHRKMATQLLQDFNFLHNCSNDVHLVKYNTAYLDEAEKMQVLCEWHICQAMKMDVELNELQSGS